MALLELSLLLHWCLPALPDMHHHPLPVRFAQVGNYTVRLSLLSKDAKWTKALKLMLADLKVALQVGGGAQLLKLQISAVLISFRYVLTVCSFGVARTI
jgi:hypothetical protein